jgi:prephenate dehydratase
MIYKITVENLIIFLVYCIVLFSIRYTFYLEFLASEFEDRTQNALMHLREQSQFVRILGSYPKSSQLIQDSRND